MIQRVNNSSWDTGERCSGFGCWIVGWSNYYSSESGLAYNARFHLRALGIPVMLSLEFDAYIGIKATSMIVAQGCPGLSSFGLS